MIYAWSEPLFKCSDCGEEELSRLIGTISRFSLRYENGGVTVACIQHPTSKMTLTIEELETLSDVNALVMRKRKLEEEDDAARRDS